MQDWICGDAGGAVADAAATATAIHGARREFRQAMGAHHCLPGPYPCPCPRFFCRPNAASRRTTFQPGHIGSKCLDIFKWELSDIRSHSWFNTDCSRPQPKHSGNTEFRACSPNKPFERAQQIWRCCGGAARRRSGGSSACQCDGIVPHLLSAAAALSQARGGAMPVLCTLACTCNAPAIASLAPFILMLSIFRAHLS